MGLPAYQIPEKIFFKIGEVCDLVGVQPHVLRYWETEFPMLSPQKNRAGQRTYRRRDVEIALRIKELLYEDLFTIAGAKKKLQSELREGAKLKIVPSGESAKTEIKIEPKIEQVAPQSFAAPEPAKTVFAPQPVRTFGAPAPVFNEPDGDFDEDFDQDLAADEFDRDEISVEKKAALNNLREQLSELMQILNRKEDAPRRGW